MRFNRHVWPRATVPARDLIPRNNYSPELYQRIKDHLPETPTTALEITAQRGAFSAGLLAAISTIRVFAIDTWRRRGGHGNLMSWMRRHKDNIYTRAIPLPGLWSYWARTLPFAVDVLFIHLPAEYQQAMSYLELTRPFLVNRSLLIMSHLQDSEIRRAVEYFLSESKQDYGFVSGRYGPNRTIVGIAQWT